MQIMEFVQKKNVHRRQIMCVCVEFLKKEDGREERGKVVVAGVDLEIEIPP